jgi:two-component system, NarL family, invasion response regulator UvrY
MNIMRVLLADDHAIIRQGLRKILAEQFELLTIGEAANAVEVLSQLDAEAWDLLVLDVSMPGRSGLDVLHDVKVLRPRMPVLVLSLHPEDQLAVRALRAGAAGYLTKDAAPDELVAAVLKVLTGGRYVSEALADKLATGLAEAQARAPHELLSDREFEVLRRIAASQSVTEIAAEIHLSVKTVSTYRTRLLDKLGLTNNVQLARYAVDHGLVDR